jgi:hypothetical protein
VVEQARSRRGLLFGLCLTALLLGYLDYLTGPSISMTLFYLAPVAVAGWTLGPRQALLVALLAGAVSLFDAVYGPTSGVAFLWNSVSRTCILGIAAFSVGRIRRDRERLVAQDAQRAHSLRLLDLGLADPARELTELADRWDGDVDGLKVLVRRRADEMMFMARDFSAVVRDQTTGLSLHPVIFDFVELIDELRGQSTRPVLLTGPDAPLLVHADRARTRQVLSALIAERASSDDELSFLVDRRGKDAQLVISSGTYRARRVGPAIGTDDLGLSVDLTRLLFEAQGGTVELARNPLSRSLRITLRLPLAA